METLADDGPTFQPRWFSRIFERIIEVPAVLVTFAMMFVITANALTRTLFNQPIPDSLEIVQFWFMPFVALLGFVAAQATRQHIAADLLFERFPEVTKPYVIAVCQLLAAVICFGFAWYGFEEAVHAFDIEATAGLSNIPAWPNYFLVPLVFGTMAVQFAFDAVLAIVRRHDVETTSADLDRFVLEDMESHAKEVRREL